MSVGYRQRVLHRFGNVRGDHRLADLRHGFLEQLPVLGPGDGFGVRAQQADALLGQKALLVQLHGQRQAGLAAQSGQNGVGLFLFDDPLDGLRGQRLQIDLVRHGLVGHDGGGVGVAQHHVHAGFLQNAAGLGAGIVKLGGLSDDNGAGADDEYLFDAVYPEALQLSPFHQIHKPVKEEGRILGAGAGFRVELDSKRLQLRVVDALAGAVVGVGEATPCPRFTVSLSTA